MNERSSHRILAVPHVGERSGVHASERTIAQLPAHIALTPEFTVGNKQASAFYAAITKTTKENHRFPITGGMEEELESSKSKIRRYGGAFLYALHDELFPIARKFDKGIDTANAGDNYEPYTEAVNGRLLPAGRLWVSEIQIARKESDVEGWHLASGIPLGEWK